MSENTWYQQSLTPPQVYELNVRIGIIPSEDHAQALAELKDPTTGVLLGQGSVPHRSLHQLPELLEWCIAKALPWLDAYVEPF